MRFSRLNLSKLLAVLMVLALVLCSCSKNEEETDTGANGVTSSVNSVDETGKNGSAGKEETTSEKNGSTGTEKNTSAVDGGSEEGSPKSAAGTEDSAAAKTDVSSDGGSMVSDDSTDSYPAEMPDLIYDAAMAAEKSGAAVDGDYYGASAGLVTEEGAVSGAYRLRDGSVEGVADMMVPEGDGFVDEIVPEYYQYGSHMLSAAEWNDNRNFEFLKELIKNGQETNYKKYFDDWDMDPLKRIVIHCDAAGQPAVNAMVTVKNANGMPLCATRTDAAGDAYCYYNLNKNDQVPTVAEISYNGENQSAELSAVIASEGDDAAVEVSFAQPANVQKKLELMFVVDTTGSMGDEIEFLKDEVADVIRRVREENGNIPVSLSMNFYRDRGDAYVVRSNEFSDDIEGQIALLMNEYAEGGGDYEEAVEQALADAVSNHNWSEDSIKVMFMILDAPPHNTSAVREVLATYLPMAAEKGIRIVPIAASGVDKSTEFLLRTFAMVSGGTYCFLTNDSGIGGSHIEATVGDHVVEYLDDLMVRVIGNYITGQYREADPENAFKSTGNEPIYVGPIDRVIIEPIDYEPVLLEPVGISDHEKNALLILTDRTADSDIMTPVFDEIGADIVTCEDWDDCYYYYIKFREDKTDDELAKIMEQLEENSFVTSVEFNMIYTIE